MSICGRWQRFFLFWHIWSVRAKGKLRRECMNEQGGVPLQWVSLRDLPAHKTCQPSRLDDNGDGDDEGCRSTAMPLGERNLAAARAVLLAFNPRVGAHRASLVPSRLAGAKVASLLKDSLDPRGCQHAARRAILLSALAAVSKVRPVFAEDDLELDSMEDFDIETRLIATLRDAGVAGAGLNSSEMMQVDVLIKELELRGGNQRNFIRNSGVGQVPWVGAWDLLHIGGQNFNGTALAPRTSADIRGLKFRLATAREFIYGAPNKTAEELGISKGGIVSEFTYVSVDSAASRILVSHLGDIVKPYGVDYTVEFTQPAGTFLYRLEGETIARDEPKRGEVELLPVELDAFKPSGASNQRVITYMSTKLFISRNTADGVCSVLQRSSSSQALTPPLALTQLLTGKCAEYKPGTLCRTESLF